MIALRIWHLAILIFKLHSINCFIVKTDFINKYRSDSLRRHIGDIRYSNDSCWSLSIIRDASTLPGRFHHFSKLSPRSRNCMKHVCLLLTGQVFFGKDEMVGIQKQHLVFWKTRVLAWNSSTPSQISFSYFFLNIVCNASINSNFNILVFLLSDILVFGRK